MKGMQASHWRPVKGIARRGSLHRTATWALMHHSGLYVFARGKGRVEEWSGNAVLFYCAAESWILRISNLEAGGRSRAVGRHSM